jgi:CRP/FNR family transcriptional regulator, cyclic AMP receptor protein
MDVFQKKFPESNSMSLKAGEVLFQEGDTTRELFVVQDGELQILKHVDGKPVEIGRARRGDFLGEMSMLEGLPRSATVKAVGECRLLSIEPGGFLVKIRRDPTFAYEMLQNLSRRIRLMNEKLMEMVRQGQVAQVSAQSLIDKSEFEVQIQTNARPVVPRSAAQ